MRTKEYLPTCSIRYIASLLRKHSLSFSFPFSSRLWQCSYKSRCRSSLVSGFRWYSIPFVLAWTVTLLPAQQIHRRDWVDPHIGTGGGGTEYGGTMPFVSAPFGAISWTAQTRINKVGSASYAIEDKSISGFIATRQPAIWMGDYGYFTLMPEVGVLALQPAARSLSFRHDEETASPAYYSVLLHVKNGGVIHVESTATSHCSYWRFTFPRGAKTPWKIAESR